MSTLAKFGASIAITCILCGILAGFGGWAGTTFTIARGADEIMGTGIGARIGGVLGCIFFSGVSLAAITFYCIALKELWSESHD